MTKQVATEWTKKAALWLITPSIMLNVFFGNEKYITMQQNTVKLDTLTIRMEKFMNTYQNHEVAQDTLVSLYGGYIHIHETRWTNQIRRNTEFRLNLIDVNEKLGLKEEDYKYELDQL